MNLHEYEIMYQVEDRHFWYQALRRYIFDALNRYVHSKASSPKILDVGCGTGATLSRLNTPFAIGLDISGDALAFCRERGHAALTQGSALALPLADMQFDAVLLMDVLYHKAVPDKKAALDEMYRILKPGGYLLLNVPAYQWLYSSHDVAVHTDHRFTRSEIRMLLRQAGFTPVEITYWNTVLFLPIAGLRLMRKWFPPATSDLADTSPGLGNMLSGMLLALEFRLNRIISMPLGVSIWAVARR